MTMGLARDMRQIRTFILRAALNKHAVGPIVRWAITGRPATRSPLNNRAPTRRSARAAGLWKDGPRTRQMEHSGCPAIASAGTGSSCWAGHKVLARLNEPWTGQTLLHSGRKAKNCIEFF